MAGKTVKIAAIQAEPVWNDLQGGVDKAIAYIQEAAANGTNVLGFPEVFIPGYPWYVSPRRRAGKGISKYGSGVSGPIR